MDDLLISLIFLGVVCYVVYTCTKSGMIDDAIKYFKHEILKNSFEIHHTKIKGQK